MHLSRAYKGVIFDSVTTMSEFMAKAAKDKGLQVFIAIIDKFYQ